MTSGEPDRPGDARGHCGVVGPALHSGAVIPEMSLRQAAGGQAMVELEAVGVCYRRRGGFGASGGEYWALLDVSLDVRPGETLGVIGRNGAGKTTLLKVMAGIIEADRGLVRRCSARASLLSLQVGFQPQLSGRENAVLSSLLLGEDRRTALRNLVAIAEFAGLTGRMDEPLATYSSGMRARLGFSVAYHASPDLLLIDEVLGVGDQAFRQKSSAAIKALISSERTVVLVSHALPTIRELCNRVAWIENGATRLLGPTEEVLAAYLA